MSGDGGQGDIPGGASRSRQQPESLFEALVKPLVSAVLRVVKDPSSPASKRALGIFLLVVLAAYFLLRKGKSNNASNRGSISAGVSSGGGVTVKSEFEKIPAGHKVAIVANDTLIAQDDLAAACGDARQGGGLCVMGQALPSLLEVARCCDLYIITQCDSDQAEEAVRLALGEAGLYDAGMNPRKVLFCGTEMGRGSMVILSLRPFIQRVVAIRTPHNTKLESSSVCLSDSLADYFERARNVKHAQAQAAE